MVTELNEQLCKKKNMRMSTSKWFVYGSNDDIGQVFEISGGPSLTKQL